MEYFTLEEDNLEVTTKRQKRMLTIFVPLFVLFLFFLLRSFEVFTIEYHTVYINGKYKNEREIFDLRDNGSKFTQSNQNTDGTFQSGNLIQDFGVSVGISKANPSGKSINGDENEGYLGKAIRQELQAKSYSSKEIDLSFKSEENYLSIEKFDMTGFYWFPLLKKGEAVYSIKLAYIDGMTKSGHRSDKYFGNFTGTVDFEVYGICSVDRLKKQVSDAIVSNILANIEEDFKEYR